MEEGAGLSGVGRIGLVKVLVTGGTGCISVPARLVPLATAPTEAIQRLLPKRWRCPADREAAEHVSTALTQT